MIYIEWRHYRIILAIRNTGSLTQAARTVNLTQSAATHQVKEAERRLGVDLVRRQGRSLQLTPAGMAIAEVAAVCAPMMKEAENKARELSHGGRTRLRISFGPQDGLDWVADVSTYLSSFRNPMQLDLVNSGRRPPTQCLRLGEADLAFEVGVAKFPDTNRYHVGDDELVCIFARDHLLSTAESIWTRDIAAETYFAHSLVPQPGFELEAFFQHAEHRPAHVAHIESLDAILTMVAAGLGVSIQPYSAVARAERRGDVVAKHLSPKPVTQQWYLHTRSDIVAAYGESFLSNLGQIIAPHLQAA